MVSITTDLVKEQINGLKHYGPYQILNQINESDFSRVKCALNIKNGCKYSLKIYKKLQLKKQKEYHKKKDGNGMIVVDMLMKVMSHEIGALQYINQHADVNFSNICKLHEILESEEKLVLVFDYCDGGQILQWDYKTLTFF